MKRHKPGQLELSRVLRWLDETALALRPLGGMGTVRLVCVVALAVLE